MDSETIRAFLANRAFVYQLFHRIFAEEPDGQLLEVLADRRTGEQLGHAVGAEAGSAFLDPLSGIAPDAFPEHAGRLSSDYVRLFIGPGRLPAPPWESVYRSGQDVIFQQSTLDVRNAYRSEGYLPVEYPRVADDHLAIELSFMAALSRASEAAFSSGDSEAAAASLGPQARFLAEHMLVWVPLFTQRLAHAEKTGGFYLRAASALCDFCRQDLQALDVAQGHIAGLKA